MPQHPALSRGRVAVITGAASGIGRAAALRFAGLGLRLALADIDADALDETRAMVAEQTRRPNDVLTMLTDVSDPDALERLRDRVLGAFGEVAVLMNNAGREGGGALPAGIEHWHRIIDTNLWGVVHGIRSFLPAMLAQGTPGAIIVTGSKQGITCPPGDTAYNASKAAVKVVTEALAHDLRNTPDCRITAHLLVPGFTYTGFTRARGVAEKPAAAWTPEQVVDFLLPALAAGDFYILCPDNETTRDIDAKRIRWAADDIVLNRPALSRWHPDHKDAFTAFLTGTEP